MPSDPIIKLLVVEDDPSLREGICDLLEIARFDYELDIDSAENGLEALTKLKGSIPDLIISDIMMPRMNGYKLLESVRKNPKWTLIPFIFLTAKGTDRDILQGRLGGVDRYITKPFDNKEFLALVDGQISRSKEKQLARERTLTAIKRNILQILNHEFRTPLTYVTAYSEMLQESIDYAGDSPNLNSFLSGILSGCDRLINLIEDMVMVMDVTSGRIEDLFESSKEEIDDLPDILRDSIEFYAPIAAKNKINISYDLGEGIPAITGSRYLMSIMLKHLVENAIKFTAYTAKEENGGNQVDIKLDQNDTHIVATVTDTGIGIAPEAHQMIFDLFYQHQRENFEQQGSGSGLPIVKGVIESHSGYLEIDSEEGAGFTARAFIPKASYLAENPDTGKTHTKRHAKILIVEDDESLRMGLAEILSLDNGPYHLEVTQAVDGLDGYNAVEKNPPDLIISDLMMPEMDGYELLEKLRQNDKFVHIPFIILTAKSEAQDIQIGRRSGAELYLTKPYKADEVLGLLYAQLDRHFSQMEASRDSFEQFKHNILKMLQPDFRDPLDTVNETSKELTHTISAIGDRDQLRDVLTMMQSETHKISSLIEDFMSMAEIETGEVAKVFDTRAVKTDDISLYLQEALSQIDNVDAMQHVQIKMEHDTLINPTRIESSSFIKGMTRLIEVALDLSLESGTNEVLISTAERDNSCVQIAIGFKATAEVIENLCFKTILKPQRTDEEIFNEGQHAIKLKIVNGIIQIHQGTFDLEEIPSLNLHGFVIRLPITERDEVADQPLQNGKHGSSSNRFMTF